MFCNQCGRKIDEEGKFCGGCGTETKTKKCVFCKTNINVDAKECPNCKRILIENIASDKKGTSSPPESYKIRTKGANYSKLIFNKGTLIVVAIIIFLIWVFSIDDTSYSGTKAPLPEPVQQISYDDIKLTPTTPAVSLTNGTILEKDNLYLKGEGELNIDNGTSLDALAKLIRNGKSVLTVYIKANSKYIMTNISDGVYWLAFAQGSDWDSTTERFRRDTQYSAFDETFDFTTSRYTEGDYINTEYSIFEVTLNPVIGGNAETSSVDPTKFNLY